MSTWTKEALASLTKEQKLELLNAVEEKHRRVLRTRPTYKPHPGQRRIHESQSKIRFVRCANGFGKSCVAVHEAFWRAQGYNPLTKATTVVPAKIAVVLDKPGKFESVFIEEANKWFLITPDQLEKRGKPFISAISFPNGSVIELFTHEQDLMTFESIEIHMAIFDEPPPRAVYVGLRRAGRIANSPASYLLVGTALGQAWMKEELWDPWERGESEEVECFTGTTSENESNLAKGYIASFSKTLSEAERRVRLEGGWFNSDGFALAHLFKRDVHVMDFIEWAEGNPCVLAIDPHPSKAHCAVLLGADKDNYLYVLKEWKEKALPRDFARTLLEDTKGYRLVDIICDSLGSSDYTGGEGFRSFIQVANSEGLQARATTYSEKSDEDFIARIQTVLSIPTEPNNFNLCIPKLRYHSRCVQSIRDTENVQWMRAKKLSAEDVGTKPKLDITHKDMLACIKYALSTNLFFRKTKDKIFHVKAKSLYGLPYKIGKY